MQEYNLTLTLLILKHLETLKIVTLKYCSIGLPEIKQPSIRNANHGFNVNLYLYRLFDNCARCLSDLAGEMVK